MLRILTFSDLHTHLFRQFSSMGSRLEHIISIIPEIFKIASERGCTAIFFEGDWNHEQGKWGTLALNRSIEELHKAEEMYPGLTIYAISGNHDHQWKNIIGNESPSALTALADACPNFKVMDYGYVEFDGVRFIGIPYMEFPDEFITVLESSSEYVDLSMKNVLLMHQVPSGSKDPIPAQVDSNHPLFDPFVLVLNGHVHRYQIINERLITVGSPIHHDLGDIGQTKGVLIIEFPDDEGPLRMERIPIVRPEFRRVKYGEIIPEEWKSDYIVIDPPPAEELGAVNQEQFSSAQSPNLIVQAYGEHEKIDQVLIDKGLSLL